jgi:signal transduction histidine kinase
MPDVRFSVRWAAQLVTGLEMAAGGDVDVVLLELPPATADFGALHEVRAQAPMVPIVTFGSEEDRTLAARAVQEGAQDHLGPRQADGPALARSLLWVSERARRRQAESGLDLHTRQLRLANDARSELLFGVAHEWRTPLNSILGFVELLRDGRAGQVSELHLEFLGDILVSARRLQQVLGDFLDLSRVETGHCGMPCNGIALPRILDTVRGLLRSMAVRKQIEIEVCVDPDLGPIVTDPLRLKSVLYQCLFHALQFAPEGSQVTVRIGPEGEEEFHLQVEHQADGPLESGRRFVELTSAASTGRPNGVYLGLALARHLLEAQGGRLSVRPSPDLKMVIDAVLPLEPRDDLR